MNTSGIIALILALAPQYGIPPNVAVAVAKVESSYNPNAIGQAGEVGLFQIMPDIARKHGLSKKQLLNPKTNIRMGLEMLEDAHENCVHKEDITWLICYNYGQRNAKKIKHPHLFPYVKKVKKAMGKI